MPLKNITKRASLGRKALWIGILLFTLMSPTAVLGKEDSFQLDNNRNEAQVSTYCTPPTEPTLINTYKSLESKSKKSPWQPDPLKTTCLTDKIQILQLCQRLYPLKTINNIVESNHNERVIFSRQDNGRKIIKWIKPYRCLESPFQSDALLVPSPCIFDHVHNSSDCRDGWESVAKFACQKRAMGLKSYAVLLPCGVGTFTGVEFVCCPKPDVNNKDDDAEEYDEYDDDDDEDLDDDENELESATPTSTTTTTTPQPTVDPYFRRYDIFNEHQNYLDASDRLESLHKSRLSRVMSDWSKLEDRYQGMRESDPRGAEEFKKTVTIRFQKTVKSLEEENLAEKKQLFAVHETRVQQHLNERKKEGMECFTRSLNEQPSLPHRVRKCLERLMRSLHKDRHHALSHYKHSHYESKEFTLERLGQISSTARESLALLERHTKLSLTLRPLIEDYVLSLQGRQDPPGSLLTSTPDSDSKLLDKLAGIYVNDFSTSTTEQTTTMQTTTTTQASSTTMETKEIPMATEKADLYQENEITHLHSGIEEFQQEAKTFSVHRTVYHRENRSVYLTMAFAGIAVFGAMVTGLVVLRRRSPRSQGFLAVGQHQHQPHNPQTGSNDNTPGIPSTPEEKHVISMQVNGYENPTYKFFESK